jgi:hypothetical protein
MAAHLSRLVTEGNVTPDGNYEIDGFIMRHQPFLHQLEEWRLSRELNERALLWEMGVGKSKVLLDTAAWLYLKGKLDIVIIFAKKGEYRNWFTDLIPDLMSPAVTYRMACYRSALSVAEKRAIKDLVIPNGDLRILIMNVESLLGQGGVVARAFTNTREKQGMLVVDESTCIKNSESKRSVAVYELQPFLWYRRIMTGTGVTESPMDLWGQNLALGRGMIEGITSKTAFRSAFMEKEMVWTGKQAIAVYKEPRNIARLNAAIKTYATIKERRDCVDLPDKLYQKVEVELTDQQQDYYQKMRDEAIVQFGDGQILEATNALGVISRLDQIACGQLKKPDGTYELLNCNRPEALITRLEISRKKSIIWCAYHGLLEHVYAQLIQAFGPEKVGRFYGGVKDRERQQSKEGLQDPDNPIRFVVANQKSMGFSHTLTTAKENWYYSNHWSLELRLQSEDRTMRIGQDENVLYTDFYSRGTVNEKIIEALRGKRNMQFAILGTTITDWI